MVLVFASLLAGSPAVAQQTEARIAGTISDQNGGALPGVTVTVTSSATGAARTAVTDEQGRYTITNLPPGTYTVAAELSGFGASKQDVSVGLGDRKTVDATLQVAGLTESVTVAAQASTMDLTSARIGVNVSPEEIEQLPVNGRNFANLMTLATGATSDGNGGWASVRFNGKSNQQNYLNYDGVDGTYVWDASPGYLNATGSQFRLQTSMESIAEFRVNSGLAPAESGLGSGGNITVISKSGANRFSGSLFEFLRNDALDSASKYDGKKQELEFNQFGGSLGGPIVSNRTFFFGSYEGLRQTTGLSFTEAVPSDEAIRRIMAGEPVGSGGGQSADRTKAVAPLLAGFPRGTVATANALLALATLNTEAEQREDTASFRLDHRFTNNQSFYARLLYSDGRVDTPDRTVTPRRVLATQHPMNFVANHQSIFGTSVINELKIGFNRPQYDANAFGPSGYDPTQVSLSGTVTSQSIDARGTTGIARSGLLVRATSNASTNGQAYDPRSISLSDAMTITRGGHTFKVGGEYRNIASKFQFLGSTEITLQQHQRLHRQHAGAGCRGPRLAVLHAAAVLRDRVRAGHLAGQQPADPRARPPLRLLLGGEGEGQSLQAVLHRGQRLRRQRRGSSTTPTRTTSRRGCRPSTRSRRRRRCAPATATSTGRASSRTAFSRSRTTSSGAASSQPTCRYWRIRSTPALYRNLLSVRGYTHDRHDEYNVQYGVSIEQELFSALNLSVGYTGSRGKDMFLRGVANTFDNTTRQRQAPSVGQVDYKTSGCVDGLVINGNPLSGCGRASYDALQIGLTRRFRSGLSGGLQYQYSRNEGTTQGSNEAATASNTFDYNTEFGTNPTDLPHSFNGSLVYMLPFNGPIVGGWRVGGILNARSGVPINVTIARPDTVPVNGVTVTNIPGGNSRGTQRPDLVAGVNPYLKDGVRWLNPAAFAAPMPGTFGNLPRNYLRGPEFWQLDMNISKDVRFSANQGLQLRLDLFNITNRLNYESPAAGLPAGTVGQPFTDAVAGTFGYMLGPLNRTVGLGAARQTQLSVRFLF